MSRDKQIEEMADDIRRTRESYFGQADYLFAKKLYEDGYRKIKEDPFRRCTCLALGCDIADDLKREVAEEIFADLDEALGKFAMKYSDEGFNEYFGVCEEIFTKVIYPIKKKYKEEGK